MLYGCEAWSLTVREFENRILRRIFGLKRDKNGEGKRLQNEELHSLYRPPNIVRVIKSRLGWASHIARINEILTGKPSGKRPLGKPRHRCEDNIRVES